MTFNWDLLLGNTTAPVKPAFVPHFRGGQRIYDGNTGKSYPLNDDYFATRETADFIAAKFGDGQVYEVPFEGSGGPMQATANIFVTKLPNGRGVNTGILAAYYKADRNPEDKFPGLAEKLIRADLEKG